MDRLHNKLFVFILLFVFAAVACADTYNERDNISLAGTWRLKLDSENVGIEQKWYNTELEIKIVLPGIFQSQGYGDLITKDTPWVLSLYDRNWYLRKDYKDYARPGNTKVPFLCQPPRHYLGKAWYQKNINIPESWAGKRVGLFLERTRWETTIWLDGSEIGSCDSLVAPHEYELGILTPGPHKLTVCVDNGMLMGYRPDAHSVSDSLGSTWNGIVGKIELFCSSPVWIDEIQAYPDIHKKNVSFMVKIANITGNDGSGIIQAGSKSIPVSWTASGGTAEFEIHYGNIELWSEFNPKIYQLDIFLKGNNIADSRPVSFGFREISTDGNVLLVNGVPSHFRGTHSGGDFPETGYPATDIDYWRNLFRICRDWGLNHMRFHSFCPPEAAFSAADELGIYLQPEAGMWNVISPNTPMEKRMYEECERMIRHYGNHPSFVLFSPSNEPKGHWKESLTDWVEYYRKKDTRRLYTTGTGWPLIENPGPVKGADFLAVHRVGYRPVRDDRAWFGRNFLKSVDGVDVPVIVHELGQWCAYPDFDVIRKFTGYMQPGNYEIFRDSMAKAGLLDMNKRFADASGRLQAACYKEEIEANLRTPGLAGFQLLDLHDYVGQGTALVGVLDAFWQNKGYIRPAQWRRFCSPTVPLAVLKKRVFTTDEPFDIDIQIAHYGPQPLKDAIIYWQVINTHGKIAFSGEFPVDKISQGSAIDVGHINADLAGLAAPAQYQLVVGLSGTNIRNDWNFWLYPAKMDTAVADNVFVTRSFDDAVAELSRGRRVLLIPRASQLQWTCPPIGRKPIFWNRLMGPKWERFLGLFCNPNHPALKDFITEKYYQWHWRQVFEPYCRAINLDSLPGELTPLVWMIDDWNRNYKLAALFECKVGKGRLLVSAADLETNLESRPVAAQLRQSIINYMSSELFTPDVAISEKQLMSLHYDNQVMRKLGAVAGADSENGAYKAANLIDGFPDTYWLSAGPKQKGKYPHEVNIEFPQNADITGLLIMNRQDQREHQGDVLEYTVEISNDGNSWQIAAKGTLESTFDLQEIDFGKKVSPKHIKLIAGSGFAGDQYASFAEIGVIYVGPPLPDKPVSADTAPGIVSSATEEMYEAVDILRSSTNQCAKYIEDITADSESNTDPVEYAFDGNPQTFWHSQWRQSLSGHPHYISVELKQSILINGLRYLPRQDHPNGRIRDYSIETSSDGKQWITRADGSFSSGADAQIVMFDKPVDAKYIRLVTESEQRKQDFASVAELVILTADSKPAPKPLYRDPVFDGAADPVLCFNHDENKWFMFYTNRRANAEGLSGVSWVHGTPIGIAESADGGVTWKYRQDANIGYKKGDDTYWAPDVMYYDGTYHMYLTYVPGIFNDWSHPRDIIHLTSKNLLDWDYQSTLKLASDKVIDADVYRLPNGKWRMWYNNERDRKSIYYADSDDLYNWQDKGKAVGDRAGEGPTVFQWKDYYWMVVDNWRGLGIYRSEDCVHWDRQKDNLVQVPGTGTDDQVKGGHPDVVVNNGRAYLFYFTHPGRTEDNRGKDTSEQRRSSIQVVELEYKDGWLACDRNKQTYIKLK